MSARTSGRARRWLVAVLLLGLPARAGALTLDELPSGRDYTVAAIDVRATGVSAGAVRKAMLTTLPPWWKPWQRWWKPTPFNREVFTTDLARVRAELRRSGHYAARVDYDLALGRDTALAITLDVEAGDPVRVTTLEISAADFAFGDDERTELAALVPLAPGAVFDEDAYAAGADALAARYRNAGYAHADVARRAVVDTGSDEVAVTYAVTRGTPAVFGTTTIGGAPSISEGLVRRELAYAPGDPWDPRKLDETQARVFGLHLFRSVTVKPANLATAGGVVDVAIEVVEGPTHEVQIGLGYGLEDGPRGQLRWQSYDFLGDGRQLGVRLKASLIEQTVESEFRQPFFLAPTQTLIVPLTQTREDEPAYTLHRVRLAPRVERKIGTALRVAVGYDLEYDDLSNVPNATVRRLDEYEARGFVSSLTGLVERSTVTDLLDPREGSVVTLQAEQAGGPWQGDYSFYRATLEAKRYWPVFGTRVVAARLRAGVADAFGQSADVPLFRRFYAGGINSTRGYGRWMLGPLSDQDDPVGGRTLVEGNVEFRSPIWRDLGGVVFLDVGEIRRQAYRLSASDLQFGAGVGVRYHTIVGPLRLDLGIPFVAPPGEPSWQIHFSIGQAF